MLKVFFTSVTVRFAYDFGIQRPVKHCMYYNVETVLLADRRKHAAVHNGTVVCRHSCCAIVHWLIVVIYCPSRGSDSSNNNNIIIIIVG